MGLNAEDIATQLTGAELVLATHNAGKVAEFDRLLAPLGAAILGAGALGLTAPEETSATFEGNAAIKAKAAAAAAGRFALADDSGLAVDALGGAPGVASARFAEKAGGYLSAFEELQRALRAAEPAGGNAAAFICVLCLAAPDGETLVAEGRCTGRLRFPPSGTEGFGYDPIFVPDGADVPFAEMTAAKKAQYSHRARATAALLSMLGVA